MDTTNTSTQFRAGFFVILGLLCIGSLVIYFGRFGESMKKFYTLTVEYRNASGLLKGGMSHSLGPESVRWPSRRRFFPTCAVSPSS